MFRKVADTLRGLVGRLKSTKKSVPEHAESRFEDPRLKGHLPGDVHPDAPGPGIGEWDRSSPLYSAMVKELAGSVAVKEEGTRALGVDALLRRPLPKVRHTVDSGFDENLDVPPGTLNVTRLRQVFRFYQGQAGDKSMSAEALAMKFEVDGVLMERVLRFHALPEKRGEKFVKPDVGAVSAPKLE